MLARTADNDVGARYQNCTAKLRLHWERAEREQIQRYEAEEHRRRAAQLEYLTEGRWLVMWLPYSRCYVAMWRGPAQEGGLVAQAKTTLDLWRDMTDEDPALLALQIPSVRATAVSPIRRAG